MKNLSFFEYIEKKLESLSNFGNNTQLYTIDSNLINNLKLSVDKLLVNIEELQKKSKHFSSYNKLFDKLSLNQIFFSDIIQVYLKFQSKENSKSSFVLAYYFDAIINNKQADPKKWREYNVLANEPKFKELLQQIKSNNNHSSDIKFIIPNYLNKNTDEYKALLMIYKEFIYNSFDLTFNSNTSFEEVMEIVSKENLANSNININDTLENALFELNNLIGLENIKTDVQELINFLQIQKKRTDFKLKNVSLTLHTVFTGPPGTGKTTVARLLGRILKHLGFLSKGHIIETDREGLIAGFVGQTALKVEKIVNESKGGILFIDEAYALTEAFGNDFGSEAVNTLLKRMEDLREDFVVIVAGYTIPMNQFINSNPGLKSRFTRSFNFEHFNPNQLQLIFEKFCVSSDFELTENAKIKINDCLELLYEKRNESFGNARSIRNIFEKTIQNQATRLIKLTSITSEQLKKIEEEDIPEAKTCLNEIQLDKI